jgi:iron(III) transport system permease protein
MNNDSPLAHNQNISKPAPAGPAKISFYARHSTRIRRWLPFLLIGSVLGYLILVPLILLVVASFKPEGLILDPGFTFKNFVEIYTGGDFLPLLGATLVFALGATGTALFFGISLAWLVERTDLPLRGLVRALIILPMATPPVLLAIGWTMLLSPRIGLFNEILKAVFGLSQAPFNIFSFPGMIFIEGLSLTPSTFLILSPTFRNMDPNLEEAAITSGASSWMVIRRVIVPLVSPAILAAAAFLLIVCFVVFDIPGTLGLPVGIYTFSSRIYYLAEHSEVGLPLYGQIAALAMFFLAILFVLGFVYQRLTRHGQRFITITGRGYRARPFRLHRLRYPAIGFVALYFFLGVLAPLSILLWESLMPYQTRVSLEALPLLTLKNHLDFLSNQSVFQAATNSVTIALVSATAVAMLAMLVAWVVVRSKSVGRRVIDLLSFAPVAIPGVLSGVALCYVYLTLKFIPIYGTIWIIAVSYITYYSSYGSRTMRGVMMQMHPELEEAGRTSGASWLFLMRRITMPLIAPGMIAVWVWVVAHAMRELSAALMLQGMDNPVVSTLLWEYWSGGEPNKAAAVGVWLMAALVIVVTLWHFSAWLNNTNLSLNV